MVIAALLLQGAASFAQTKSPKKEKRVSNTTISLFANFNSGKYYFAEKQGQINTTSHATNFGIGISKDYYLLTNRMYLSVGFRYFTNSSKMRVGTTVYGFDPEASFHDYELKYDHYVVPVYVGKTIKFPGKSRANVNIYGGFSVGISGLQEVYQHLSIQKSNDDGDEISASVPEFTGLGNFKFYSSFDLGFRVAPFNVPNFSVGVTTTFDLIKSENFKHEGDFVNFTKLQQEDFKFDVSRRFFNLMISANYTFGKRWKRMLSN